jgi:hypothetical protein
VRAPGLLDRKCFFPGRFPTSGENAEEKELIGESELGGKMPELPGGL